MVAWFDSVILNWFQSIQNEFLTVLFKAITFLGEGGLIWIALGLCLFAYKKTQMGWHNGFTCVVIFPSCWKCDFKTIGGKTETVLAEFIG